MEQVNAIRSFEELQYIVTNAFNNLWNAHEAAREKGEWLIYITEKEDKLYIKNANLETALRIPCEEFAKMHEERVMGIRTVKRDLKRLGVIIQANTKRNIKKADGTIKAYSVTVMSLDAIDWIMDTPLLQQDTIARLHDAARESREDSWLRRWAQKMISEQKKGI